MPAGFILTPNISITLQSIPELLKPIGKEKLYQVYLDKYKEMGYLEDAMDQTKFFQDMFMHGPFDGNWLRFAAMAKRAKKPIRREVIKVVRFLGKDGKEYVRYAAVFYSEDKHEQEISQTTGGLGVWEEPVFRKEYDRKLEDFVDTMSIAKTIPHYECPWPAALKELEKDFVGATLFYLQDEARKYRIHDKADWKSTARDVLINREREKGAQDPSKVLGELVEALQKQAKQ